MQRRFNTLALLAITLIISHGIMYAQDGSPNTAFGDNGLLKQHFLSNANSYHETATGIVHLKDGKSVISVIVNNKTVLTRINPDGSIDESFGKNGYSQSVRISGNSALAVAPDGSYYIAGGAFTVAHLHADGTVDKSYGINGMTSPIFLPAVLIPTLTVQEDGKVILAGGVQTNGNNNIALARFNHDGSLDASFGVGGKVTTDFGFQDHATAVAVQPDGKIVIGGLTGVISNGTVLSIIRYNGDGQLDLLFGKGGRVATSIYTGQPAAAVKVQPDGKLLLAGSSNVYHVFRYQYDGTADFSFGSNGVATDGFFPYISSARAMELLPDGKIIIAGEVSSNPGAFKREIGLVAFDADGLLDKYFGNLGKITVWYGPYLNWVRAMKLREDGRIMIVGSLQPSNGPISDYAIVQCKPSGFLDPSFGNGGQVVRYLPGEVSAFRSMAVQADSKIIAGGHLSMNNEQDFALARFNLNGSLDESFGDHGKVVANIAAGESISAIQMLPDGRILAGGNGRVVGQNFFDIVFAVYHADGRPDLSFGQAGISIFALPTTNEALNALAIQKDGKFLAGGSTGSNPGSSSLLARYHPDGSLDKSFGQGGMITSKFGYANALLNSIEVLADGRILTLVRGIHPTNQGADIVLAQFNSDGSPDLSFGTAGIAITNHVSNDVGRQIKVDANGRISVAGTVDAVGNSGDFAIFRYHADGTPDLSFGDAGKAIVVSAGNDITESFAIQADGKYVLSGQSISGAANHFRLTRFNHDGSVDLSFGRNGSISADIEGDEVFHRSEIIGDNIYLAGSLFDIGTTAAMISYVLNAPVKLVCPSDVVANTHEGVCAAVISGIDPVITPAGYHHTVNYNLAGETSGKDTGSVSGKYFNKGVTTVTYALAQKPATSCSFNVTVNDTASPSITVNAVTPAVLWPVDQKMKDIELVYELSDNCGVADSSITISSNEEQGRGESDWEIVSNRFIRLRAERLGTGTGRIYTVTLTAKDGSGNTTVKNVEITVPKHYSPFTGLQGQGTENQSLPTVVSITGLNVKMFSNPTRSYFTLQVSGIEAGKKVTMRVINASGVVIDKKENLNIGEMLNFGADYKTGIYFVEIISGTERKQFRILKQ